MNRAARRDWNGFGAAIRYDVLESSDEWASDMVLVPAAPGRPNLILAGAVRGASFPGN